MVDIENCKHVLPLLMVHDNICMFIYNTYWTFMWKYIYLWCAKSVYSNWKNVYTNLTKHLCLYIGRHCPISSTKFNFIGLILRYITKITYEIWFPVLIAHTAIDRWIMGLWWPLLTKLHFQLQYYYIHAIHNE